MHYNEKASLENAPTILATFFLVTLNYDLWSTFKHDLLPFRFNMYLHVNYYRSRVSFFQPVIDTHPDTQTPDGLLYLDIRVCRS